MATRTPSRGLVQAAAAGIAVVAVVAVVAASTVAATQHWVFAETLPVRKKDPSLAQLVLADRATVGFIRLAIVLLAVYVIASVPALVIAGRWSKGFSTTALTADDAVAADTPGVVAGRRHQIEALTKERDTHKTIADEVA